jgi:hypothetical protein
LSTGRAGVAGEHDFTDQLDRNAALFHEFIVEFLQRILIPFGLFIILAQFVNLQLAQRVVKIRGIVGAAPGLFIGVGRLLEALLDEDLRPVLHRHALRVQTNSHHVAAIAQQRLESCASRILGSPPP